MRFLLDTNALLWTLLDSPRIKPVRHMLLADENEVFVSAVSWWEIAIKTRIGKLDVNLPQLRAAAKDSGFLELPLSGHHAQMLLTLPAHHNDPFDHMLIAQALAEPLRFITGDEVLPRYSDTFIKI